VLGVQFDFKGFKMKKNIFILFFLCVFLSACSSSNEEKQNEAKTLSTPKNTLHFVPILEVSPTNNHAFYTTAATIVLDGKIKTVNIEGIDVSKILENGTLTKKLEDCLLVCEVDQDGNVTALRIQSKTE
jgi:hypothetical protein